MRGLNGKYKKREKREREGKREKVELKNKVTEKE